ncbi:MAG: hypothetical protein ACW99Q_28550, partial [Candidatus Kariarchaeaceae archaeon]
NASKRDWSTTLCVTHRSNLDSTTLCNPLHPNRRLRRPRRRHRSRRRSPRRPHRLFFYLGGGLRTYFSLFIFT